MEEQLKTIAQEAQKALQAAESLEALSELRVRFLGKKGELTGLLREMGGLPAEQRPVLGQLANRIRDEIGRRIEERTGEIKAAAEETALAAERIDVTLPGRPQVLGARHLITRTIEEISAIFQGMGFAVERCPDVESDYYCYEALNIPKDHPARDMQDSYYVTPEIVLRTHTTAMDVRMMQKSHPRVPVKVIVPGRCFRRDDDLRHSPMFHQVDGMVIDERITLGDLKGTLLAFVREMFGEDRVIRLRPSFFPFTQPSAEVDVSCVACGGKGCRLCSGTGWLEILGSGLIHPYVLRQGGYDPEKVSGFAFGMGVERVAMLKYGVDNIRTFFTNDRRFIAQF